MKTYTVVCNWSAKVGENFKVHKKGCRDVSKYDHQWDIDGETLEKAIQSNVVDLVNQEMSYTAADFKIMPCLC